MVSTFPTKAGPYSPSHSQHSQAHQYNFFWRWPLNKYSNSLLLFFSTKSFHQWVNPNYLLYSVLLLLLLLLLPPPHLLLLLQLLSLFQSFLQVLQTSKIDWQVVHTTLINNYQMISKTLATLTPHPIVPKEICELYVFAFCC